MGGEENGFSAFRCSNLKSQCQQIFFRNFSGDGVFGVFFFSDLAKVQKLTSLNLQNLHSRYNINHFHLQLEGFDSCCEAEWRSLFEQRSPLHLNLKKKTFTGSGSSDFALLSCLSSSRGLDACPGLVEALTWRCQKKLEQTYSRPDVVMVATPVTGQTDAM